MAIDATASKLFYEFGNDLLDKMLGNTEFILVDKSETALAAFRGCLLNVGLLLHIAATGHCHGEREKARLNREILAADEIAKRAVQAYATYYTRTIGPMYPWILSCVQAHLTKANVDTFETFVSKSYSQGVKIFRDKQ